MEKYKSRKRNRGSWGLGISNGEELRKWLLSNNPEEERDEPHRSGEEPSRQRHCQGQVQEGVCLACSGTARRTG